MRFLLLVSIALVSAILALRSADAEVRVTFVNSYHYGDFQDKSPEARETTLTAIRSTLDELGARYLGPHEILKIEVLDIAPVGLAIPPMPTAPSQMEVQFVLQRHGKTILHDHDSISDVNYLENLPPQASKDPLVYEKQMLRDWFEKRFGGARP